MNRKDDKMGAVYVTAKLSNAGDIELADRGLMGKDEIRTWTGEALVDPGSTLSIIPTNIAERLGLRSHRQATGIFADGNRVSCGVSLGVRFEIDGRDTSQDACIMGDAVVIGQTVLESTDLLVDCVNRKVIPNPAHPDGPALRL
jgi:predicted aspartyl protease